ncbi:MAG: hypothetical protein PVSMB2_14250 [Ktedonobacteraceae bacterium]
MLLRKDKLMLFLLLGCLLAILSGAYTLLTAPIVSVASMSVSTNCPAPGTGRAAFLPPLALGQGPHQTLVYSSSQYDKNTGGTTFSNLKRYDVTTKQTTTFFTQSKRQIFAPQVSADGQWILFSSIQYSQNSKTTTNSEIQLIRVDGQYLQTLYCVTGEALAEVQWSTDQKLIAFLRTSNSSRATALDLLNTHTGAVQRELTTSNTAPVNLSTWLDTQHIYLTNIQTDAAPDTIYLLDIRKGANQHGSDLVTVFHNSSLSNFDSSYNGKNLYTSICACGYGNSGPSTISVEPAAGGHSKTVYANAKYAITQVRVVTPTTLLFVIFNTSLRGSTADTSHNGLWEIRTDGTGLTRLAKGNAIIAGESQFPWSNVSRNHSFYASKMYGNQPQVLLVGPLNGGTPTTIATAPNKQTSLENVGWTIM